MNNKKELESTFSYDKEKLANFIARVASEIRKGSVNVKGEKIDIPQHLEVKYEFEKDGNEKEIEIKFKWKEQ